MLDLDYSLVIEATEDPDFFGFYSPDLEVLKEQGLPLPPKTESPTVILRNEQKAA